MLVLISKIMLTDTSVSLWNTNVFEVHPVQTSQKKGKNRTKLQEIGGQKF